MLGSEKLWEKTRGIIERNDAKEDVRWASQELLKENRRRIAKLLTEEEDERMKIWIRVELGGEKMTAIGRELGYRDGSGVHRVVQRLNERAEEDKDLINRMFQLRGALNKK